MAPEGLVVGVVAICQYLLKETPLVANCTYLEKSQVWIFVDGVIPCRSSLLPAESSLPFPLEVSRMLLRTLPTKLRLCMLK